MFRFWYRYVFANRTLIETGAQQAVWTKRIEPDYNSYMGLVFEKICTDYLCAKNAIDLIANDGKDYIFGGCKRTHELLIL